MPILPAAATLLLADPGVSPNTNGLPGVAEARKIVGAVLTFGLIASVAGLAISALAWALSAHNGNSYYASRGKVGVLIAAGAALLLGGANAIITFFQGAGASL
jgi:Family of unknown function (DUF6112)